MPIPFLANIIVGLIMQVVGYMIAPGPKREKLPETDDLDGPTAEAGRPIIVAVGSIRVSGLNNLGNWDKKSLHRKANLGGKK